jgi:hypothetical protein
MKDLSKVTKQEILENGTLRTVYFKKGEKVIEHLYEYRGFYWDIGKHCISASPVDCYVVNETVNM